MGKRQLQAIETAYKGCRFRSRLEARWAVYFDALGWHREYEPEGFELGEGLRYLPDFLLHAGTGDRERTFWVEIKPNAVLDDESLRKIRAFSDGIEWPFFIIMGEPWQGCYEALRVERAADGTVECSKLAYIG